MIPTYESCCLNWGADKNYKYLMFEKLNLISNFYFIFLKYIYFFSINKKILNWKKFKI